MKNIIIAIVIGLFTSVVGGYTYAHLIKINFPFIYLLGGTISLVTLLVISYFLRGKFYLLYSSSIIGYFPKGQSQYLSKATFALSHSKEVIVVGARGMDLIGEYSPFSKALRKSKILSKIDIILLEPGGRHSRLRSEHLEVERKKYEAECVGVENFIGVLKVHEGMSVNKYSYTTKPLLRMLITDKFAFVSLYKPGTRGKDLPCWQISRNSTTLFPLLEKYTDNLKRDSKVVEYSTKHDKETFETENEAENDG